MMRNASRTSITLYGSLMGLAGIEHGIGEIIQGSHVPESLFILSWPEAPFFRIVNGEPALTIIPNLLVTGILAAAFSLAFLLCAAVYNQGRRTGQFLMLLSIPMLLTGAGLFPPVLGFLLGAASASARPAPRWWMRLLPAGLHIKLGRLWVASLAFSAAAWLFMCPGLNFIGITMGVTETTSSLMLAALLAAVISLPLTIFSGYSRDAFHASPEEHHRLDPRDSHARNTRLDRGYLEKNNPVN